MSKQKQKEHEGQMTTSIVGVAFKLEFDSQASQQRDFSTVPLEHMLSPQGHTTYHRNVKDNQGEGSSRKDRQDFSAFMRQKLSEAAWRKREKMNNPSSTIQLKFQKPIDISVPSSSRNSTPRHGAPQASRQVGVSRNGRSLDKFLQIEPNTLEYFANKNKEKTEQSGLLSNMKNSTYFRITAAATAAEEEGDTKTVTLTTTTAGQVQHLPHNKSQPRNEQMKSQPNLALSPLSSKRRIPSTKKKTSNQTGIETGNFLSLTKPSTQIKQQVSVAAVSAISQEPFIERRAHFRTTTTSSCIEQTVNNQCEVRLSGTSLKNLSVKPFGSQSTLIDYTPNARRSNHISSGFPSLANLHSMSDSKPSRLVVSPESRSTFYGADYRSNLSDERAWLTDQGPSTTTTAAGIISNIPTALQSLALADSQIGFFRHWIKQGGFKKQPGFSKNKQRQSSPLIKEKEEGIHLQKFTVKVEDDYLSDDKHIQTTIDSPASMKYRLIKAIAAPTALRMKSQDNTLNQQFTFTSPAAVACSTSTYRIRSPGKQLTSDQLSPQQKRLSKFRVLEEVQLKRAQMRINASKIGNSTTDRSVMKPSKERSQIQQHPYSQETETVTISQFKGREYEDEEQWSPSGKTRKGDSVHLGRDSLQFLQEDYLTESAMLPVQYSSAFNDEEQDQIKVLPKIDLFTLEETTTQQTEEKEPATILRKKIQFIEKKPFQTMYHSQSLPTLVSFSDEVFMKREDSRNITGRRQSNIDEESLEQSSASSSSSSSSSPPVSPMKSSIARSPMAHNSRNSVEFSQICSNISSLVKNRLKDASGGTIDISPSSSPNNQVTPQNYQRRSMQRLPSMRKSVFIRQRSGSRIPTMIITSTVREEEEEFVGGQANEEPSLTIKDPTETRIKQELSFFVPNLVKALDNNAGEQLREDISYFCTQDWNLFTFAMSQYLQTILKRRDDLLLANRWICPFKLCTSIGKRILDIFLAELQHLETVSNAIEVFRRLFESNREMIVPVTIAEKLGSERQVQRMVKEVVSELIIGQNGRLYESFKQCDLEKIHVQMMRFVMSQSPQWNEEMKTMNAMDVFESKRLYLKVMRRYDRLYSESVCLEFIEWIERSRPSLTHCAQLNRLAQEKKLTSSIREYLCKIQAVNHLPLVEKEAVISAMFTYVLTEKMSSVRFMKICEDNSFQLTAAVVGEINEMFISHLRAEVEFLENAEHALAVEYKFKKLIWRVDSHPLKRFFEKTGSKGLTVLFSQFDEQVEQQIMRKHSITVYDEDLIRGTAAMFGIIESYFSLADIFAVKDTLFAVSKGGKFEAENQIQEFWIETFYDLFKDIVDQNGTENIIQEIRQVVSIRAVLKQEAVKI